jgi:hypothetical protein
MKKQRHPGGASAAGKPHRKPRAADRLALWLSTGLDVDGLWVGSFESNKPRVGLRRVEDALQLIKHHDSLHYARVIHNLERVWVNLLPYAFAHYDLSLKACVLDERFVLRETTTLEEIASSIIHEATHARLERCGISYNENDRSRIEAVCLRRELNFIARLPHSEPLREQVARTLEWCVDNNDDFSNASLRQHDEEGTDETLRYLGAPDWFIGFLLRMIAVRSAARRLVHRFAGRPSRQR